MGERIGRIGETEEIRLAMPDEYKVNGDSITAYKKYYNGGKRKIAKWTRRDVPDWWILNTAPDKEVQNAVL